MCLIKFTFCVYDWTFITDGVGDGVKLGKKVTAIDTVQQFGTEVQNHWIILG